ncbi:hypothetical protein BGY98DRAFT_912213 [Russula aff. rugulosa BPL654]|nr:hypothetical protein BGY98DRAFT_912213 [Russula aff. rugulosa BPL654]
MLRAVSTRITPERPDDVDVDVETAIQAAGINDDDWLQKLLEVDEEQLILIISYLVNKSNIDNKSLKRVRIELPSFSTAKWAEFAAQAGLPKNPSFLQFKYFGTPVYQLPPSFHNAVFENSWRTQDVYQEPVEQSRGESRVRILDPYIVPILALFQGRVVDGPEEAMPPTVFATGGEIEHEIVVIGGILFFVIEVKQDKPTNNNMAQLFLEFLSAANLNKDSNFEGLRVYGVLTNLTRFAFFSYDPMSNTFCRDEEIFIDILRDGFASGMMHITNKIFGLVLSAFIDVLRATVQKNNQRDVSCFAHQDHDN